MRCSLKRILIVLIFLCAGGIVDKTPQKFRIISATDPPLAYMIKNLAEQAECARKAGFVFKQPMLRVKRPPYEFDTPHGWAYMELNIIVLVYYASYETMAHEMGHIIDAQMKRKGHPFFVGKENWDIQSFAEAIKEVILNECKSQGDHVLP